MLFEDLSVGVVVGVGAGHAKGIHFPRMVSPAHAKDDPSASEDVGGGIVFRQSQRVPHGIDVEAAAEAEILGQVGQVDVHHQQVWDALVALVLEVVFGRPKCVVAQFVHFDGDGLRLGKY